MKMVSFRLDVFVVAVGCFACACTTSGLGLGGTAGEPTKGGTGGTGTGGNVGPGAAGGSRAGGVAASGGRAGTGGAMASGGDSGTGGAATGGRIGTGGATASGGDSGTGGAAATGGRIGTGGMAATGGNMGTGGTTGINNLGPLCVSLITVAGVAPTKNGLCMATDPQLCYKTCGPEAKGFKSETCAAGVYVEQTGCTFPPADYSCYRIPAVTNASCPTVMPQASMPCTVPTCVVCGAMTGYLDSTGAAKIGYCVCPTPSAATGVSKWSCATTTNWPCPAGQGC